MSLRLEERPPLHIRIAWLVLLCFACTIAPALALEGDVIGDKVDPIEIAIPAFTGSAAGGDVTKVITDDLGNSGYFAPLDPSAFIEQIDSFGQEPKFANWAPLKVQALVTGEVVETGGKLTARFRLWDVNTGEEMHAMQFAASAKNWRRLGHLVADEVYSKLTGYSGYFDTHVVFVDETGPKEKRVKRLAIMDQDGANVRTLKTGGDLLLTPRFSPSGPEITYMSFEGGNPRVYLFNIETGQKEIVGDFPNMSFSPRFSPDGQSVIMSLENTDDSGNANIFVLDLRSKNVSQLTDASAINTAPSYKPDGSQIVFESDRGGGQQIYMMNADGSGQRRISFGKGRYSTPVWSPDGKWIAFTKQANDRFAIGVMAPDGSGERILTDGYHNEGPTWAPNSKVIMFFRNERGASGGPKLYSVDVTGFNEHRIKTPNFGSDPAWSPLLH